MIQRFLKLIEVISSVFLRVSGAPCMLTEYEIRVLTEGIQILGPFELATKEFSTEKHISACKVIPIPVLLEKKLTYLKCSTKEAKQLLDQLRIESFKRFHNVQKINLLAVSTILDPRFKRIHFQGPLNTANAVLFIQQEIKHGLNHSNISNQLETV